MCKPTAGNGGHKKDWYSWFTVYDITEQLREEAAPSLSEAGIEEMKAEFLSLTKTIVQILNGASHLLKNQSDK